MKVAAAMLSVCLFAVLASVSFAEPGRGRACAPVQVHAQRYAVSIEKGRVRCATARKVLRAFLAGRGTMHGPGNGPAYKQYWTLYGWRCGHGAGGGGCIRHGSTYRTARDWIIGQST